VKPFAFPELLARIRALVRRGRIEPRPPIKCADLEVNVASRSEMLARDVWKETSRYTPLDNVIDVHIARLRRKIDDNFTPKLLYTVRGLGFILREIIA
jgi:two-component system, OmpR family, copper resistance phosphate regulon response regulator CusR